MPRNFPGLQNGFSCGKTKINTNKLKKLPKHPRRNSYEQTLQNNKKIMPVVMPLAEIYSLIHSIEIYFYTFCGVSYKCWQSWINFPQTRSNPENINDQSSDVFSPSSYLLRNPFPQGLKIFAKIDCSTLHNSKKHIKN